MLRKIRIALAALFLMGMTLLFIGVGQQWWGWMAKIQFLPSCLALNFAVIAGMVLLTLLFGRIYCSVICPLGVLQDFALWIRKRISPSKKFAYHKERKLLRYGILVLYVAAIVAGLQVIVAMIAPYSAYGRIVRSAASVLDGTATTGLVLTGAISLLVIVAVSVTHGRAWCNNICPVGTTLGLLSRFSLFKPRIDEDVCVGCHSCEKKCKAGCIDSEHRHIDYSRCISCGDCIRDCKVGAIRFRAGKPGPKTAEAPDGNSRRKFIATAGALAAVGVVKAQDVKLDGGLAEVLPKQNPQRNTGLVPFGAKSSKNFYDHCTACQLCVSACPNGVLRPGTDLGHFLQPLMGYDKGYCRPECVKCSEVCPSGAILPITADEKTLIHIGVAHVNLDLCVVNRDDVDCGNCARHCPVGAIRMVENGAHRIPTVIEDRCIGCGACENLCPSRPLSAITVEGLDEHRKS